jgi:TnpA family transposase
MPRRSILSAADRSCLLALPDTEDELIRHYTFSEADLSLIRQRRGDANRLGVAVQLCLLRFPDQGQLPERAGRNMRNVRKPGVSICSNCVRT